MSDIIWAAGLLDGEACIALDRQKHPPCSVTYHPYIQVDMTSLPTLTRLQSIFGGGRIWSQPPRAKAANPKSMYRWRVYGAEAIRILQTVVPHLFTKASEARIVLEAMHVTSAKRELFYWECRRLKQEPQIEEVLNAYPNT
jgi:hypothetical protein